MGEIHELFVLALSLVWFAGATPDTYPYDEYLKGIAENGLDLKGLNMLKSRP